MTSDTETSDSDLHVAVRYGDLKEVQCSLNSGLSPNKIGLYQWSPLHEAASCGYTVIISHLLKHGADPNLPDNLCSNTAVHYAAMEGNTACLNLLLDAGGNYAIENSDGDTALDLATRACQRIIEKKRVEKLIRLPLTEAKIDANNRFQRIESSQPHRDESSIHTSRSSSPYIDQPQQGVSQSQISEHEIKETYRTGTARAWAPQITKPDPGTMGMLHVSFEYNSKKSYLKVRLWKLTGLLISQTHSSMINTLYVKSTFVPDVIKSSKRRSEEIKLSSLLTQSSTAQPRKKPVQSYVTHTGTEVIFEPITFKFSKPLVYEQITPEIISDKVMYIQVSVKQKYTQKTYVIADLTLPLNVAVTKIVKEAFPLRIYKHTKLPDSMMILPDIKQLGIITASDPNLRHGGSPTLSLPSHNRPASDVNLREIISLSSHSASISIDIPSEDEMETCNESLSRIKYEPLKPSSEITIPMPGRIEDSSSDEEAVPSSIVVETHASINPVELRSKSVLSDTPVTITVTNDGDSDSSDSPRKITPNNRSSKLTKLLHKANTSTDKVVLMENGDNCASAFGFINQGFLLGESTGFYNNQQTLKSGEDSVALDNESHTNSQTKKKLKLRLPHKTKSGADPAHHQSPSANAAELLKSGSSDVVLSLGDLELEDMDKPAAVHTACRRVSDEDIV